MREHRLAARASAGLVSAFLAATVAAAGELDPVLAAEAGKIQVAQASQQRIDRMVDETEDLEAQYKQVTKELDGLKVYNDYLERQIADQIRELEELHRSIDQVSSMERQIMPLMIRMLDALDRFVELDVPFLRDERTERVARLRATMERADVSAAEKFRRLTEAFQIEIDYGRTIEAYKDSLELDGATLEVNVLRLGRIGLYYQTADASVTGMWDVNGKRWTPLDDGASRNQVRQGLRIAGKQIAPDLLLLPVPAAEPAS
jgi:septal ring factor EnvC (AmiA/AmiB activator)